MQKLTLLVLLALSLTAFGIAKPHRHATTHTNSSKTTGRKSVKTVKKVVGYKVKPGDSDWTIAHKAGLTVKQLRHLNGGKKLDVLRDGATINVMKSVKVRVPHVDHHAEARRAEARAQARREEARAESRRTEARRYEAKRQRILADRRAESRAAESRRRALALRSANAAPAKSVTITNETLVASAAPAPAPEKAAPAPKAVVRSNNKGSVDGILKQANSFRGVRYSWGAMSRAATDCSGFTSQVFRANGYRIPRTSAEQSRVGAQVDRSALQAGDLIFFKTIRGTRVSHVGIYVGDNHFIHASSGGHRVMVSSLNESYYSNRFVTARRLVKGGSAIERVVQTAKQAEKTGLVPVEPEQKNSAIDIVAY